MNPKPAIFLDRDGVINKDYGYVSSAEKFELLPGVKEALLGLKSLGFYLVVISNQSGVARGFFTEEDLNKIHDKLKNQVGHDTLDLICYCPHLKEGIKEKYAIDCLCRKPKIGMIETALENFNIDLESSYLVGDKPSDMECAFAANIKPVYISQESPSPNDLTSFASLYDFYKNFLN